MNLVDGMRQKDCITENGAVTNSTSLDKVLDMFFLAGASRRICDRDIEQLFIGALADNRELALKCLFWARDCRGGAGERRFFQVCWDWLHKNELSLVHQLGVLVPEFGRWSDIFETNTPLIATIFKDHLSGKLSKEYAEAFPLLCKWMPRKGKTFNSIRVKLKLKPKELRKLLVENTEVVETQMCKKEWDSIKYENVPSVALNKYRKAFERNDTSRYNMTMEKVISGEATVNSSVLFPHNLYQGFCKGESRLGITAQWNCLPNYMEGSKERILPVCDVSASMIGEPMDVSVALGCYISERNEGIFKDAFITFSDTPRMMSLSGDIFQRFSQLRSSEWGYNTNLSRVFSKLLSTAVRFNIPENKMPTQILILSDMEFDEAQSFSSVRETNYESIREIYEGEGYKLPKIVFWNLNGRPGNVPANKNDNVALVSGFSPAILKDILSGAAKTAKELMVDVLMSERYSKIKA